MSNRAGNLALGIPKLTLGRAQPWVTQAACQGTDADLWFVERDGSYHQGKLICARCTVRTECLSWAVETKTVHGLFGGLAPHERKSFRRGVAR